MQFVYQPLVWGFLITLIPLLIHLINMMRHRRVKWAAMEFLLQSYKKHRKWVWLKQLLLLLMRMAAIALIVAMLAQWITHGLGGTATHHYVLLDDSFSMSDRQGGTSAFERGVAVVQRIAAQAADQDTRQKFTLIRYSRAARAAESRPDTPESVADFSAARVDADFDLTFAEARNTWEVTESSVGPRDALAVLRQLMDEAPDENRLVYVVSDFRTNHWDNPAEVREVLRELEQRDAKVELVQCVTSEQRNLGIVDFSPGDDTRAAGVPLFMNLRVKNFGSTAARNVQVSLRSMFHPPVTLIGGVAEELRGEVEELPTVLIDNVGPGETVSRNIQIYFPAPGQHVVEARLPEDPVAADNRRWCVIDFPEGESVLIVDGSVDQDHAYYLSSAFQPGLRTNTGIRPDVQNRAFLRDISPEDLNRYAAIYLLDVDRVDDHVVGKLEDYVRGGGGLAVFVGENVLLSFYNSQLYRDGEGLMPLPLDRTEVLLPNPEDDAPDFNVIDHPVFSVFTGDRNPFIRQVSVLQYVKPPPEWKAPSGSTVQVLAQLRDGSPLAVERSFGNGRVVVFLTSIDRNWNNWATNPSFVVVALKLQSHLASASRVDPERLVGSPLDLTLDLAKYEETVKFFIPTVDRDSRLEIDRRAEPSESDGDSLVRVASLGRAAGSDPTFGETDRSGVYDALMVTTAGAIDARRYALNVDPVEGDLTLVGADDLRAKLDPVKPTIRQSDEYEFDLLSAAGFNRSVWLMAVLIGLLLVEQVMGYLASYHPASGVKH